MPRHCCVPCCNSNYASALKSEEAESTFSFPKNSETSLLWLKAIHREDYTLKKNSVVCAKHFRSSDIIRASIYKDEAGNEHTEKLTYPKLIVGSVPSIFENQPKYLSSSKPPPRCDPEERRKHTLQRKADKIQDFLNSDNIHSFSDIITLAESKLNLNKWNFKVMEQNVFFYLLNVDCVEDTTDEDVKVIASIKISDNLIVSVFINNNELSSNDLKWILSQDKRVTRWSQIINLLSRYSLESKCLIDSDFYVEKACVYLNLAINNLTEKNFNIRPTLELLENQLYLLNATRKQYTMPTLLFSFAIYSQSSSTYNCLRKFFNLPTKRYLQHVTSSLIVSVSDDITTKQTYLLHLCSGLNEREKIVCLLVDEIYLKSSLNYKAKTITGYAVNNVNELAKTMQTFMIISPFGHFKEVVRLLPVQSLSGNALKEIVFETIKYIQLHGFKILAIITDNNRVNQNMFKQFSDTYYITNPDYANDKIFLTYDSVHILKNIRNNWINLKDPEKSFIFPSFENPTIKQRASFMDLRNFYKKEINSINKKAYKINDKTLYPNTFERQNVSLVQNIFHDSTIAALKWENVSNGTATFLEIIKQWWDIVNVKNVIKGKIKRNEWSTPIYSSSDFKIEYLQKFLKWLDHWHNDPAAASLTKDTYKAIKRSTTVLIDIVNYSFINFDINYILTGKFQTDNLEKRFGRYRNLSGCSYNVSVRQIFESENKIRIQNILKSCIESEERGSAFKDFKSAMMDYDVKDCVNISEFAFIFGTEYLENYQFDEGVQLYICGYVAHCIRKRIKCDDCLSLVVNSVGNDSENDYFNYSQRGGLCISTDEVKYVYYHLCAILDYIISDKSIEVSFLSKTNHQHLLTSLTIASLESDNFAINFNEKCHCGKRLRDIFYSIARTITNITLNNYTKSKNNIQNTAGKKRKLQTLY